MIDRVWRIFQASAVALVKAVAGSRGFSGFLSPQLWVAINPATVVSFPLQLQRRTPISKSADDRRTLMASWGYLGKPCIGISEYRGTDC